MDDRVENPGTPTGDAAENFLKARRDPKPKPDLLQQEVLNLYKRGDEIRKTLQAAIAQGNPVLSDYATLEKVGLGFDYTESHHDKTLKDIKAGEVHLVYKMRDQKESVDPHQPRISFEGQELTSIEFGIGLSTSTLDEDDVLEIILTAPNPEVPLDGRLTYGFYVSDRGAWIKNRLVTDYSENAHAPYERSQDSLKMTPVDLELVGTALSILKNHINRVLNSAAPNP